MHCHWVVIQNLLFSCIFSTFKLKGVKLEQSLMINPEFIIGECLNASYRVVKSCIDKLYAKQVFDIPDEDVVNHVDCREEGRFAEVVTAHDRLLVSPQFAEVDV
jgi:hypothetical protein